MDSSVSSDDVVDWLLGMMSVELDIRGLRDDSVLIGGEVELDSLEKVEILLSAEERYGVDLGYADIPAETWRTPTTIARMIHDALA